MSRDGDADQAGQVRRPEFLETGRRRAARRPPAASPRWREIGAGAVERALQPRRIDRLHQIIDRRDLEGGDRELVEGGDEHDRRRWRSSRDSARATSIPSRPGMAMSSSSRSGASASAMRTALSPSLAVPTRSTPSIRASSSCSRSAASGSSSAIRILKRLRQSSVVHRHGERNLDSRLGDRAEAAVGAAAETRLEPLADVGEAEPGALVRRDRGGDSSGRPARARLMTSSCIRPPSRRRAAIVKIDRLAGRRDAIFDRILDQRLEDQRRERAPRRGRRERRSRPSAGRGSGPSRCRDRAAGARSPRPGVTSADGSSDRLVRKKVDSASSISSARSARPRHDQRRQGVERVEQEVRIDLVAQRADLRGLGRGLGLGQAALGQAGALLLGHGDEEGAPGGEEEIPGDRAVGDQARHLGAR